MEPERQQWLDAIRGLVQRASDEQLCGMVGPDRGFYSPDAVRAAEQELATRAERLRKAPWARFNLAAMLLGPAYYLYRGMVGRGLMIAVVLLAAALGLEPVVRALSVPEGIWIAAVVLAGALYCGLFFERDLFESRGRGRRDEPARDGDGEEARPQLAVVAAVRCREAALHSRALLLRAGIDAIITTSTGGASEDERETRVLVPSEDLRRARSIIQAFLASGAAGCSE